MIDAAFDFESRAQDTLLQTEAEASFLTEWVPAALGRQAGHWFTPQASLDSLIESHGLRDGSGARRIDFLFSHPGGRDLAIEIDGPEHASSTQVDRERDEFLRTMGIQVIRVPNAEVLRGGGAMLDRVRAHCSETIAAVPPVTGAARVGASFAIDCATAAKVQFALARAIQHGWLTADASWGIQIHGAGSVAAAGVLDALKLLSGFEALYELHVLPKRCIVDTDDPATVAWTRSAARDWIADDDPPPPTERLRIAVELDASPFHTIHRDRHSPPDFVIRSAHVPVPLATDHPGFSVRRSINANYNDALKPLRLFLQHVFRKRDFREGQGEAIFNALRQNDCVVLLPTGAGKSIIYQLAGLLMPGITIVVDPIVALIDDQVEGMFAYGLDRAVPISGFMRHEERDPLLIRIAKGEYQFVLLSPERLQLPGFPDAIRELARNLMVNLAVIDEAHCVSEWGHDFRPAYLDLGNTLRRICKKDGTAPPLLALTGTASRAVLRDMLADLDIDTRRSDALIRPRSFDRKEIAFQVIRTTPRDDPRAVLRSVFVGHLPTHFGLPATELYRISGTRTHSGIVFVPTVRGRPYGVRTARKVVRESTRSDATVYCGKAPWEGSRDWHEEKRRNATAFKSNRVPVLVATQAFGMGIDKPNIRYTVHFGMPMSLERYYQEAGRAGRDRDPAVSYVIFSEYDQERSDLLLDLNEDIETLRDRFEMANRDRATADDVTLALWFHFKSFSDVASEIRDIERLLGVFGDFAEGQRIEYPFGSDSDCREKAIYRLLKIGVISEYAVDFGSKKFVMHADRFDSGRCRKRLTSYIRAANPGKLRPTERRIDALFADDLEPRAMALALARMLVEFTYNQIERSRRRSIVEALNLARHARSDADIRQRLLDYLQEGFDGNAIDGQIETERTVGRVNLNSWWQLVSKVQTEMDAGELRGLCIRALESFPDHPGLLLARAVAESMCSDHDSRFSSSGIETAIRTAMEDEIPDADIESTLNDMFDLAATRANDLGPPLTAALFDLRESPDYNRSFLDPRPRVAALDDPRVQAISGSHVIRNTLLGLESASQRVIDEFDTPHVLEILGT